MIALADVEYSRRVEKLRAAGDFHDDSAAVGPEFVQCMKHLRHACIHKHRWRLRRPCSIDFGIRQHHMKKSADAFHRFVNGNSETRTKRIGDQFGSGVVAHDHIRYPDDQSFLWRWDNPFVSKHSLNSLIDTGLN